MDARRLTEAWAGSVVGATRYLLQEGDMMGYDHTQQSRFTVENCEAQIGARPSCR